MNFKRSEHITVEFGIAPDNYPVAFASVDLEKNTGDLNLTVLRAFGFSVTDLQSINVSEGFGVLRNNSNKQIVFIVTHGMASPRVSLELNLEAAIRKNKGTLRKRNIWMPLLATGKGGITIFDSFDITHQILEKFSELKFTIVIPNSQEGKRLYDEYNRSNLVFKDSTSTLNISDEKEDVKLENTASSNNSKSNFENTLDEYTVQNIIDDLREKLNRKIYLVGSSWGENDQTERFINQSTWENGHDDKYIELVNNVNKGDFLVMKSTFALNNDSILRLKAYGSVVSNPKNGKFLNVIWEPIDNYIDINGLGFYRDTITEPNTKDSDIILGRLLETFPQFHKKILSPNAGSKNQTDELFDEKYKIHRFIRDVLNQEYNLNLVIETSRIQNGYSIQLDLSDEEAKSYVTILDKDYINNVFEERRITHRDILSKIAFDVTTNFGLLNTNNTLRKYFVFLDDSFYSDDVEFVKNELSDYDNEVLEIITMLDMSNLADKNSIKWTDYINYDNSSENFNANASKEEFKNKIPFHLDQVVDEDRLGREPVAKAFVDLLKKDIFTDKLNHSFMVHLQGKWGAGKSSFLNFIKQNLNSDIEKWIIVDYNAWQNQHINPPWWSLINQVYLQSKEQFYLIGIRKSLHLWRKEIFRRIWRYSGWQKILALTFFILFIICILYFGNDILEMFNNASNPDSDNEVLGQLGNILKLVLTSISLLTSIYGFAKFITFPFFINSSKDAKSFVLKASDPMNQVKRHFNDLVDDINSFKKKQQLAIFIDDIDRCDKENIVCLLEGIQTLFKEKRVLYIIAGDKDWISTSFGNTYEEFATKNIDKKQLGEFFIQKAFQLSFRLPNISEESKQNYWNHILGLKKEQDQKKIESIDELSEADQTELKSVLRESKSQLTNPEFVKDFQEKFNLSGDTASNIVIEEKNKDTEELRHLLQEYHKFIDTNPRSIIRLANNYTMARSILMAERVAFNEHILFRWLVIEDLCPKVITLVATVEKMEEFEEVINKNLDVIKRNNALKLLKGEEEFMQGEITIEDIKTIKGL